MKQQKFVEYKIYIIHKNGEREDINILYKTKKEAIEFCNNCNSLLLHPEYRGVKYLMSDYISKRLYAKNNRGNILMFIDLFESMHNINFTWYQKIYLRLFDFFEPEYDLKLKWHQKICLKFFDIFVKNNKIWK